MLGETVTVLRRVEGADELGGPTIGWEADEVGNCLVRPLQGAELAQADRPDGVRVRFAVALPKAYTAGLAYGALVGARVALTERGMDPSRPQDALLVTGPCEPTRPCPTEWDTCVECGTLHG